MTSPKHQIRELIEKIDKRTPKVYMGDSPEDEKKYILHNQDRFLAAIGELDNLPLTKKQFSILDIGTSPFTLLLKKRYPKAKITTLDYSNRFRSLVTKKGIKFIKKDLNDPKLVLPSNRYDVITFLEVLEHLKGDHNKILNQIIKSLKKGGICILQTPNKYAPKGLILTSPLALRFWDLFTKRPHKGEEEKHSEFIHFKEYSLSELKNLLNKTSNIYILEAKHDTYFDTVASSMVYRTQQWTKLLAQVNFLLSSQIPIMRRGMQFVFRKDA